MLCLWPLLFLKTEAWEKNSGKSLFLLWEKSLFRGERQDSEYRSGLKSIASSQKDHPKEMESPINEVKNTNQFSQLSIRTGKLKFQ